MIIYYTHRYGNKKGESHYLLTQAMGDYLDDRELALKLVETMHESGGYGKPVIDGFDHFSISHSNNTWAVLIDTDNCGFDIQYHRYCNRMAIASRFFTKDEYAAIRTAEARGSREGEEAFFAVWTRRESLVKALGLSVASTDLPSVHEPEVFADGKLWHFGSLDLPGSTDLAVSICTGKAVGKIVIKEMRQSGSADDEDDMERKSAKEAAYTYISSRMRTAAEVNTYLAGKGYSEEEILEAVNDLTGTGYLNDYEYAVRYFEHNREKKRGSLRAARELAERGVDRETVRNAREDFLYENNVDEFADALDLAERLIEGQTDEKSIASLARKLETRGFGHDIIFGVIERIRARSNEGSEDI